MERLISDLVSKFEGGTLSRRQLIGSLTALMAFSRPVAAAGVVGMTLEHVSLQVRDLQRSRDFYNRVFGMSEPTQAAPRADGSIRLDLKTGGFFVLRTGSPVGTVDHVAIRLDRFDKEQVIRQLKDAGVNPVDDAGGAGFHVVDPDGFNVQIQ